MANNRLERLLARDRTLWPTEPGKDVNLGWLELPTSTLEHLSDLDSWTDTVDQSKILWVGVGECAAARMLADSQLSLGNTNGRTLDFLDTTNPKAIEELDLDDTFVILCSPDIQTTENWALMRHLRDRIRAPKRFAAISPRRSALDLMAIDEGFWRSLHVESDTSSEFSTLTAPWLCVVSFLGGNPLELIEGALLSDVAGVDYEVTSCLDRLNEDSRLFNIGGSSPSPSFTYWLVHLLGATLGGSGGGLVPIAMEPIDLGADHTALRSNYLDPRSLGKLIHEWHLFIALLSSELGIDPFSCGQRNQDLRVDTDRLVNRPPTHPQGISLQVALEWIQRYRPLEGYLAVINYGEAIGVSEVQEVSRRWSAKFDGIPTLFSDGPDHQKALGPMLNSGIGHPIVLQIFPENFIPTTPVPGLGFGLSSLTLALADTEMEHLRHSGVPIERMIALDISEVQLP